MPLTIHRQLNRPFSPLNRRSINIPGYVRVLWASSFIRTITNSRRESTWAEEMVPRSNDGSQRTSTRRIATEKRTVNPFARIRFASPPCLNTGVECARWRREERKRTQRTRRGSLCFFRAFLERTAEICTIRVMEYFCEPIHVYTSSTYVRKYYFASFWIVL